MMIVVMVLSAVIIGATAVAGLLTSRQIRQTADAGNFSKALFAADSGFEWREYKFLKDGFDCKENKKDCPPGQMDKSCDLQPDFSSSGIELAVDCAVNNNCSANYDCWTITSSAAFKDTSYVVSRDLNVPR